MAYTFEQSYYFRPYRGNSSFWLNRYGNGSIASHQKATLYTAAGSADQRLKVHKVSGGCQLLSDLNNAYGLNIYGTKAGSVCDFYPVSGNFNDALIDLLTVDAANNLYRIKMINHNLYLTPASNSSGAALTWENASNADNQIWQLCASQSSGGGSTGGSTTITMPVNANQNYSGNSSWIINYGCAVCCGVDLASWKKNKSYTIKATLNPITSSDKVKFTSSNKKVATVNAKGVVKAKKAGKAKITVKSGKKKAVVTVKVK